MVQLDCVGESGRSFSRHGHLVIVLRKPRQLSATDWIGEAIGQRSAFLSAGAAALRACKKSYVVDLTPRRHGGDDPGEGTVKARHLQQSLSSVVVARFFLRQPLEIDSGAFKAGTRQRVVRKPLACRLHVLLGEVSHDGRPNLTLHRPPRPAFSMRWPSRSVTRGALPTRLA